MSYCRITGRSKALPKPNYFPLLPPISPSDAKRFCQITSKSYGLPSHHYIPVLLTTATNRNRCKITNISDELEPHHYMQDIDYGHRKHLVLTDYRYIFPIFDDQNDDMKILIELLNTKTTPSEGHYVYKVEERKCNLVFPAKLEAAVRDGDVRDVMLVKDSDTVLFKIKKGKSFSLGLQDYEECNETLYDGEGPTEEVLFQQSKEKLRPQKRHQSLSGMTKYFEEKDLNETFIESKKLKPNKEVNNRNSCAKFEIEEKDLKRINLLLSSQSDSNDLIKPLIESWDWNTYGSEIKNINSNETITKKLPNVFKINPIRIENRSESNIDKIYLENTSGFELIPCITELINFFEKPDIVLLKNINKMEFSDYTKFDRISIPEEELREMLPRSEEISSLIKSFKSGICCVINENIPGMKFKIENRELFIPGQFISEEFVPGRIINNKYIPGVTIQTENNNESFIPGQFLNSDISENKLFVAGQEFNGEFIGGQTIRTTNGHKFVEGQTVVTSEGLKFITGIVDEKTNNFLPGQYIKVDDKSEFVPGQTISKDDCMCFIPGQNVLTESNGWIFVPGQTSNNEFIPGKSLVTDEGSKFIPGQEINNIFVPGITKLVGDKTEFVAGINIETKQGTKFVEGQILKTTNGEIFHPGQTVTDENSNIINFNVSKSVSEVVFHEPTSVEYIINSNNLDISGTTLQVFGNMIQTDDGVEFYPNKVKSENLPHGKVIPGKLIKQGMETKFVPGMMTDDGFIPGQHVWTENSEQFVPGQVIETSEGLKFVPGQVIEKNSETKFVPGQTILTEDGPRFVPGQIIETKSGPTFIPGQIMYTEEEGERFVPGQVVDTESGPRFVPGCVIEKNDKVTFVPGQVVETSEGLKFVAPDLVENDDGDGQFSIQSFLVTPEELKLLKPTNNWTTINGNGELSIDSKMLRQLSAAGMSIGQQVEASAIDFVLQSTKDRQTVQNFIEKNIENININEEDITNIFVEIKSIVDDLKNENRQENIKINSGNQHNMTCSKENSKNKINSKLNKISTKHIVDLLTQTVLAVKHLNYNENSLSKSIYDTIGKILEKTLHSDSNILVSLVELIKSPQSKGELIKQIKCNALFKIEKKNKFDIFKSFIQQNYHNEVEVITEISEILDEDDDEFTNALHTISINNPKILYQILNKLKEHNEDIFDELSLIDVVKKSITDVVKESIENEIKIKLIDDNEYRKNLVQKTIGFAKILGLSSETTLTLTSALNNNKNVNDLFDDKNTTELICRVNLMNKLAENSDELKLCLEELKNNNSLLCNNNTKGSTKLCELVRKSGLLLICPPPKSKGRIIVEDEDETTLIDDHPGEMVIENHSKKNSLLDEPQLSLPVSLLMSGNLVAMEDYLIHCGAKSKGAFLILKHGLQMVVPRYLSHDVITGKCAFTVLDDNGLRHFEPIHIFKLLKTKNKPLIFNRFSMYSCDFITDSDYKI